MLATSLRHARLLGSTLRLYLCAFDQIAIVAPFDGFLHLPLSFPLFVLPVALQLQDRFSAFVLTPNYCLPDHKGQR